METLSFTDFFAPIPVIAILHEPVKRQKVVLPALPEFPVPNLLKSNQLSQLERADFFTYVIMGLAVLIAIVIPLLNLHR